MGSVAFPSASKELYPSLNKRTSLSFIYNSGFSFAGPLLEVLLYNDQWLQLLVQAFLRR